MTFYKKSLGILGIALIGFMSCQRHVVVPPPQPPVNIVDVDCMFQGLVNDSSYVFQEGTNGFFCKMFVTKVIQNSPLPSNAIYSDSMASTSPTVLNGIRLDLGSFVWIDQQGNNNPTTTEFESFFSSSNLITMYGDSTSIPYDQNALNGVRLVWYDDYGNAYYSRDTSTYPGTSFELTNIMYESDQNNEYVKWSALFTARLWRAPGDSVVITNGNFNGAFARRTQ